MRQYAIRIVLPILCKKSQHTCACTTIRRFSFASFADALQLIIWAIISNSVRHIWRRALEASLTRSIKGLLFSLHSFWLMVNAARACKNEYFFSKELVYEDFRQVAKAMCAREQTPITAEGIEALLGEKKFKLG